VVWYTSLVVDGELVVAAECGGVRVVWSGMNMRGFA